MASRGPDRDAPQLSILVVAYNSRDYVLDCIDSVFAHTHRTDFEILLLDNGDDGTGAMVTAARPQVRVLDPVGNIGFGAGNNHLAKSARAPLLMLLNPDTRLRDDAIDRLVDFSGQRPEAGAWGGRTITPDGRFDGGNTILIPTLGDFAREAAGRRRVPTPQALLADTTVPYRADVLCGGFMLITKDRWEGLGGFDEGFFLYSEEVDLFARLKACGLEAWVRPDCIIEHDVGSGEIFSPARIAFKTRGQMHFARKHLGPFGGALAGSLIWLAAMRRYGVGLVARALGQTGKSGGVAYGAIVRNPAAWWAGYAK